MDAIKLLESDHRKVEKLFEQAEGIDDEKRKLQVFDQIMMELTIHAEVEEKLFYPACRKFEQLHDIIDEAYEEHAQAKALIAEIDELREEALRLDAKIMVLKEDIEHHVEEEEQELFPQVRKLLGAEQLEALGTQVEQMKQRLMQGGREALAQLRGGLATGDSGRASGEKRQSAAGRSGATQARGESGGSKKSSSTKSSGKSSSSTAGSSGSKSGSTSAKSSSKSSGSKSEKSSTQKSGTTARAKGTAGRGQGGK